MNINKKIYNERVARHKYLFSYHKYKLISPDELSLIWVNYNREI